MEITTTRSGTQIVERVEYNTYPPPLAFLKVMERRFAEALLTHGSMQFGSLESYREWENAFLGDPNDGKGMLRMNGHRYRTESTEPVYAWCASLPSITASRILLLAKHGAYDCVVRVHDPLLLIQRVRNELARTSGTLYLHCAEISYDRGAEVDKQTLNSQKFHSNVFQKDPDFSPDLEYRLSLTGVTLPSASKPYVSLMVGDCSDIMNIEDLPNRQFHPTL